MGFRGNSSFPGKARHFPGMQLKIVKLRGKDSSQASPESQVQRVQGMRVWPCQGTSVGGKDAKRGLGDPK